MRSTTGSLVASLSDGTLTLLEPDQTGQLVITRAWAAHAHEPWCVAWNYYDTNVIYSGAGRTTSLPDQCLLTSGSCHKEETICNSRCGIYGRDLSSQLSQIKGVLLMTRAYGGSLSNGCSDSTPV
jgi:hypothetical protein